MSSSQLVRDFHHIPRFGHINNLSEVHGLHPSGQDYVEGVTINAGIVVGVGILLTLVTLFIYFAACCCRCCRCCKRVEGSNGMVLVSGTSAGEPPRGEALIAFVCRLLRACRPVTPPGRLRCLGSGICFTLVWIVLVGMAVGSAVVIAKVAKSVRAAALLWQCSGRCTAARPRRTPRGHAISCLVCCMGTVPVADFRVDPFRGGDAVW